MTAQDFLSLRDFTPHEIISLLDLATCIKADPLAYCTVLKGKTLAMIFEKPSLRTRVTAAVGIQQLGGFDLYLSPAEIQLGQRESLQDVAKNLERMVQGILIRTFAHALVERMAEYARVPVVNALTDFSHPCQAMADYLTMYERKGRLAGLTVAYVGDGNNVAHSLMFGGAQLGARVRVATPPGYEPKHNAVEWAEQRAQQTGGSCTVTHDVQWAVAGADVVYTDVWTSMGQEEETEQRRTVFQPYQVNSDLMRGAKPDAIFMHCLPAHRGEEVTAEVMDSPQSVVYQQADRKSTRLNSSHIQKSRMPSSA